MIGWVETHGRAETAALTEGLERLPARELEYRGVKLMEFDLDAALTRKPDLLLLDELAHTNAPGARHAKRWQDVEELRDAGINVYTTLNVQHLESLNDLVNRVTGVVVRETVPDRVLDAADEVEFIDLPPEELLKRLDEGKVYLPERAAQAVRSFFRRGNLLALRELALRRTAEHVDADVQDYRRDHEIEPTWPVAERILVCVRPNPESDRLVRAARRMAARLKAEWIVAYVESPAQPPLSAAERLALASTIKLAEDLGAKTDDPLRRERGRGPARVRSRAQRQPHRGGQAAALPLAGSSQGLPPRRDRAREQRDRGHGDPGRTSEAPVRARSPRRRPKRGVVASTCGPPGVVLLSTLVCWAMHERFDKSNLVMVYLLGVAVVATRYGRRPSALAAVLSVAAFDFFFVPPYLTFAVSDTQYLITFAVMLLVSLLISTLAARVRAQAEAARWREQRTRVLYALSRDLAGARTAEEVARVATHHVSDILQGPAEVFLPDEQGRLPPPKPGGAADGAGARGRAVGLRPRPEGGPGHRYLARGLRHLRPAARHAIRAGGAGRASGRCPSPPGPGPAGSARDPGPTGGLRPGAGPPRRGGRAGSSHHGERAAAQHAPELGLARPAHAPGHHHGGREHVAPAGSLGEEGRRELAEAIYEEAERLNRLVTNLLDMTRLESGSLRLNRDWHSMEELVGTALARLKTGLEGRRVTVSIPQDLPLVLVDGLLVEQLLVNLLDNALKYSPPGSAIDVTAERSREDGGGRGRRTRAPGCPPEARSRCSRSSIAAARPRGDSAWAFRSPRPS